MPHRIVCWVLVLVSLLWLPAWGSDNKKQPLEERPLPALPRAIEGAIVGRSGGALLVAGGRDAHSGELSADVFVLVDGAEEWQALSLETPVVEADVRAT